MTATPMPDPTSGDRAALDKFRRIDRPRINRRRSRPLASLYVAGPFSMGYLDFFTFLIPLYALSLGLDAVEIGILVGARSILALFLSIHIGVLMDRFGTRRVTLFFVWAGMALAPLFPLVPGFWGLLLLQLLNGAAVSFAWSGAQTLIAQLAEGDARYIGRFSFFARLGSTTAPILAGIVWDLGGAWPAYLFGAAWGVVLTIALLRTPEAEIFGTRPAEGRGRTRFRARDVLPRASDYVSAFMLVAIPAIAVSMAIISMRNTTYSIQTSVYVVYLEEIGLVGTTIGLLFATAEIASGFGSLFAGRAMRLGRSAAHDAERHRIVDPVDCDNPAARRDLRLAAAVAGDSRLAGRGDPAGHPVSAGAGGRPPSAGCGRRIAPDRAAADLDRDTAVDGRDRRPLGDQRKLFDSRRVDAAVVRTARADHPPRYPGKGGAYAG